MKEKKEYFKNLGLLKCWLKFWQGGYTLVPLLYSSKINVTGKVNRKYLFIYLLMLNSHKILKNFFDIEGLLV